MTKRKYMIKKKSELDAIFKLRQSVGMKHFSIYYDLNSNSHLLYAISIGKKFGSSVDRNLMKRRLRHIVYTHTDLENDKFKFVIVVKPTASTLNFKEIEKQISDLLSKIKIRKGIQHEKMDI